MRKLLPQFLAVIFAAGALSTTGCVARVHAGGVVTSNPQLVTVSPGVWVVEDYDEPVFYSNDAYWLYRGGIWYRSDVYYGGWVRTAVVPVHVRRIHRPRSYVRYHARPGVRRRAVRDHRRNTRVRARPARRSPAVRDHRRPAPPPRVRTRDHRRPAPRPRVNTRDHRRPAPRPRVNTRDHRRAAPPPVKTRDHRKKKPKADKRDHRRHE